MFVMAFFGLDTVLADLRLHKSQAGLVVAGTLNLFNGSSIAYENVCLWPTAEMSGLGSESAADQSAEITAWRTGESGPPRVDDTWTIGGKIYNIMRVQARHNHDESTGYAIYDCTCTRKG